MSKENDTIEWLVEDERPGGYERKQLRYKWFRLCENYENEGFESLRVTPEARKAYNQMTNFERKYILETFPEHKHIFERTMTKEMLCDLLNHSISTEDIVPIEDDEASDEPEVKETDETETKGNLSPSYQAMRNNFNDMPIGTDQVRGFGIFKKEETGIITFIPDQKEEVNTTDEKE